MEIGGLPMLNCLLQHTLRSLCSCPSDSSQSSAKWVYAVFWRILPRNFPPLNGIMGVACLTDPKETREIGRLTLRNYPRILVWEDGYCDFLECERAGSAYANGRFGADVFFKMSHEVYNYGEGLVGKVAAENGHKWVFSDSQSNNEANILPAWNVSLDLQPRAWELQFNSGIQTIGLISVREGIVQLGSLDKVAEDKNLVASIQRKFTYLQSLPGLFALQRPHIPIQHLQLNTHSTEGASNAKQSLGSKRTYDQLPNLQPIHKSFNLCWNNVQNGRRLPPVLPIPPLYPYAEACDVGYARERDISKGSKIQRTDINSCSLGLSSAVVGELELEPTGRVEHEEERRVQHNLGLNYTAGLELEFKMVKNKESKTFDLI